MRFRISWQNKLHVGLLLGLVCSASFALELNKPSPLKPQMKLPPKAMDISHMLVAETKQNARKQGKFSIGKHTWSCKLRKCTSSNGSSAAVNVSNCKSLAGKVGPISSFRYGGKSLSTTQLSQCNSAQSTIKPQIRKSTPQISKPELEPGLKKPQPVEPIQKKPAPLRPPQLTSKPGLPKQPQTITPESRPVPGGSNTTSRAPISIPYTKTTPRMEIIGNPNSPTGTDEPFTPITLTTSGMEIIGNPTLPSPDSDSFEPVTITTSPMEVIGAPVP